MTKKEKKGRSLSRGFQLRIVNRPRYGLCTVSEIAQKMVIWGDSTDYVPSEPFLTVHKTYRIYISTIYPGLFYISPHLY